MHKWIIDKKEEQVSSGAFLTWSDDVFFTVDYNGEKYNGEIINSDIERGVASIKLNHRVFNISRDALNIAFGSFLVLVAINMFYSSK